MDKKEILATVGKNKVAKLIRDNMNEKIKTAGNAARGAAIFIDNFGELTADVTFGDKDSAKDIGLYQLAPEIDIPAVDKTGAIIYKTRKEIWTKKFILFGNSYPGARRNIELRSHYIRLFADGKYEIVNDRFMQQANPIVAVFKPEDTAMENPLFFVDSEANYNSFVDHFNGEVAEWSMDSLMRGLSISEGLEAKLVKYIRFYLSNVSVRDVIENGLEGLQLSAKQFITMISNAISTYGWRSEERHDGFADDVIRIFGFRFAKDGAFVVPEDIVKWDDPWDHPIWKDMPLISMMYQPNP